MSRVVLVLACLLLAGSTTACAGKDCSDACTAMRDCGLLYGANKDTCEVRCAVGEEERETAIDECATCTEGSCTSDCLHDCVCTLQLDLREYAGISCGQ
jgi:hypothetical protein